MARLEAVSFAITTRSQRQMTLLQFWLTIVFGASEIGFIAASIATWYYRTELIAVLAWTLGAALVTGLGLALLLKGKTK
jgi:fatty acid desaturase